MADKVTVDKSYFDALLRRADFHTSAGRTDPASISISKAEYESLLRTAREYELLKNALFQGGLTPDTLGLLIAGAGEPPSDPEPLESWADDFNECSPSYHHPTPYTNGHGLRNEQPPRFGDTPNGGYGNGANRRPGHRLASSQRQTSYGMMPSTVPEDGFDEADSFLDDEEPEMTAQNGDGTKRTLYFCGFPAQTTYKDLLSVVKGGKILSANLRQGKSATVTFLDAAADFLTWTKRNDVYINHKRVDVRWAERQFKLNGHISNKIANGATRNILIRSAVERGLTEARIRDDMEHIHNLVIVDVTYRNGNAYVSTNSVHNALFARTCMLSRSTYKGCKVEFYPDECDVPLPMRNLAPRAMPKGPAKKDVPLANRFNMLGMEDEDADSGAENRDPLESQVGDSDDDDDTINIKSRHGVRLDFLDSESTV